MRHSFLGQSPIRFALCTVSLAAAFAGPVLRADFKDDIDFTKLRNEYGAALPTGAGVRVAMAEYVRDGSWAPDNSGELATKTIDFRTAFFGGVSGHANNVAAYLLGSSTSITPGVASLATFEATNFTGRGALNGGRSLAPVVSDWDIENHSWGGNDAIWSLNILDKSDYRIVRDNVISLAGVDNYASSTMSMMMANSYNGIAVGSSSGDHARGTSLQVTGRMKPDLVGTNNFTSYATPIVASCATLLVAEINRTPSLADARSSLAIKALLMAGATKEEFAGWTHGPTRPLDLVYGAGEVNIYNSYKMLIAGSQAPGGVVAGSGWNTNTSSTSSRRLYFFSVPTGQAVKFSAVLAWHRQLSPDAIWLNLTESLSNLDLVLWRTDGGLNVTSKVSESISSIDNVEHIYETALSSGSYALEVVSAVNGEVYGLAWRGDLSAAPTPVAPSFTTQPSSFTVTAGSSVTFTAAASGTPSPTYQWRRNGLNLSGATSASYTIANATAGEAGTYSVVATNSAGSATSSDAILTVNAASVPPSFTSQPSGQTVNEGSSVTFTAAASGSPAPTYQWRRNGSDISGATSSSLTLSSVSAADAGTYTVVAANAGGSLSSNAAVLTVNSVSVGVAPTFVSQPLGVQAALVGSSVNITAVASGSPSPSYQWRRDGVNIPGATNSTLTLPSVVLTDSATYSVVASNATGSATSNSSVLMVSTSNLEPSFSTHPSGQTVNVGATVTFVSEAHGIPKPTYQWMRNGVAIAGATSATLTVSSVTLAEAGTYTVVATNVVAVVTSNPAVLNLIGVTMPPSISSPPAPVSAMVGDNVVFSVTASGSPLPAYQWRRNGVNISGATSSTYPIPNVQLSNAGTYTVVVSNIVGTVSSNDTVLLVNVAPTAPWFTAHPTSQTAGTGGSVTFTGATIGSPAPAYQWRKNGVAIAGATGTSLTLSNLSTADEGSYTLFASNVAGSASSLAATLTVTSGSTPPPPPPPATVSPLFTLQPGNQTATTGQSAAFSVATTASPTANYRWQRLPAGSSTWEMLNNGGSYNGVMTATLTVSGISSAMSGDQFRCIATNSAGTVTSSGATLTVPAAASALFQYPSSLAQDTAGNFYVTDAFTNTIQKITPSGMVSILAGSANAVGSQDGTGSAALFNQPNGIAVDGAGNLYVCDTGNATIRRITPAGVVTTIAGSATGRGSRDGAGTVALFNQPNGIAIDALGVIYVADSFNATIRKIGTDGQVSTYAGLAGNRGEADGAGSTARFNFPTGLAIDSSGVLYVADTYNHTIRRIAAGGVVTTIAGSAGISGTADLNGVDALFNQPSGLSIDAAGNLYVADTANATIRKITPARAVSTVAGLPGIAGLADGSTALFNQPRGLLMSTNGSVYICDTGNGLIRRIMPNTAVTTLALTAAPSPTPSPTPTPTPTPTPVPTPAPATGGATTGGGGGGSTGAWLILALAALAAARCVSRRR